MCTERAMRQTEYRGARKVHLEHMIMQLKRDKSVSPDTKTTSPANEMMH